VPLVAFDIIAIVIGVVWLFTRPGTGALILLLAYEGLGLLMNIYNLFAGTFEQNLYKGLITAIVIRVFALFVLYDAHQKMKLRAVPASVDPA
jgi:hypothetical protein